MYMCIYIYHIPSVFLREMSFFWAKTNGGSRVQKLNHNWLLIEWAYKIIYYKNKGKYYAVEIA